ncbi:MAG: CopG family transcriptional regulator [Clostridiales bacterium]|nr:CopG family transcriptional regulator [Clostridiales bacterium]MBD9283686.1 CopG family transcriptional regulator [Clostridiales bacterium]
MGRPPSKDPKADSVNIRLDSECKKILQAYCEKHGIKRAEAVRRGIKMLKDAE